MTEEVILHVYDLSLGAVGKLSTDLLGVEVSFFV